VVHGREPWRQSVSKTVLFEVSDISRRPICGVEPAIGNTRSRDGDSRCCLVPKERRGRGVL
jgi:hypothetical protein